jgi:hypothetical protein
VATADLGAGEVRPHLVPLSVAWIDGHLVIAIEPSSLTARNLQAQGGARVGLGPTRDVVMIDTVLDGVVPVAQAPAELAEGYAEQADWDPRDDQGYVYVVLRPRRIQAWRESNELGGRTIMRDGRWAE